MNWQLSERIDLSKGGIRQADADRQMATARELLRRFSGTPGQILADEVGMGKTFVALAVAVSVLESTDYAEPVVVMVPPSVQSKWPREWQVFRDKCLRPGREIRATPTTVRRGSEFLKLIDDDPRDGYHIIFLTHGALTSTLTDPLIRLAIVQRALRRPSLRAQKAVFPRWAASVLRASQLNEALVRDLLIAKPERWMKLCNAKGWEQNDDPVPGGLLQALPEVDLASVADALRVLPLRRGPRLQHHLSDVREALKEALPLVWQESFRRSRVRAPLLVLDEAHHTKNPWTALASLFAPGDAQADAESLGGPLAGVFKRMLFLTATPFQLGHDELLEVLSRFDAVNWEGLDRDGYERHLDALGETLDQAQGAALRLDRAWGRLSVADVEDAPDKWWLVEHAEDSPLGAIGALYTEVAHKHSLAGSLLREHIIRHVRGDRDTRRTLFTGSAIMTEAVSGDHAGIEVGQEALLPFMLAARTQALLAIEARQGGDHTRAYFAEGLASSFEAYRHTRSERRSSPIDGAESLPSGTQDARIQWYLKHIDDALPEHDDSAWAAHPKIAATVSRVVQLWLADEKVLVFCFYIQTGRALRTHISRAIRLELMKMAARKLGCRASEEARIQREIERIQSRLSDDDAPAARESRKLLRGIFRKAGLDAALAREAEEAVLPFLRAPSFLIRRFDLSASDRADAFSAALQTRDASGWTVAQRLAGFARDLQNRVPGEREQIIAALGSMPTRRIGVDDLIEIEDAGPSAGRDSILPNVRLANGQVSRDVRERLMHGFNTPFFPEVLISSSVMGEGVDLHRGCRHVIHHDLDWNPSVIEQRTGRVDRLESKAQLTKQPVVIYEPYMEGTQDEKQFRVMKDRERWFNVVMGERLELDEAATDRLEQRAEFPLEAARALGMNLALD